MVKVPIGIRPATADDYPFIIATWLRSYRSGQCHAKFLSGDEGSRSNDVFYSGHHALAEAILSRPTTRAAVAHDPDVKDLLYGHTVVEEGRFDRPVIHYVYVKVPWRRFGIAEALLESTRLDLAQCCFSHYTKTRVYRGVTAAGGDVLLKKWVAEHGGLDPADRDWSKVIRDRGMFNPYAV